MSLYTTTVRSEESLNRGLFEWKGLEDPRALSSVIRAYYGVLLGLARDALSLSCVTFLHLMKFEKIPCNDLKF